jgi:hypothetical protein
VAGKREAVTAEHATSGTYVIVVGGRLLCATVGLRAPVDPSNERFRS